VKVGLAGVLVIVGMPGVEVAVSEAWVEVGVEVRETAVEDGLVVEVGVEVNVKSLGVIHHPVMLGLRGVQTLELVALEEVVVESS
jgi:hypothetical protein